MTRRPFLATVLAPLLSACSPQGIANGLTPRGGTTVQEGIAYGPGPRARYDLYAPAGLAPDAPLIVFFYGGGWTSGSRDGYGFVAYPLAALGALVAVPDYRLLPEGRWPVFLQDGAAAVAAIREGPGRGRPIILMGHSAGAFIAVALTADPRWLGRPARDGLSGCIALAGPYSYGPEEDTTGTFRDAPDGRARAAPPDAADLRGAPPFLLLHGTGDRTVRPAQTTRFAELLRSQNVPVTERLYPDTGHIGIVASFAAPLRELGLAGAPVLDDVAAWLGGPARRAA
ncbi:alpha/beta hydrolase [Roseomonas sp. CCTCC AB2023176]|uniref:alpha/beta hydrolase n=1 Tax=Roseomonas sp. CCTCC AB2023176 TaxID=3342640 RepID=UPI0035D6764B